MSSGLKLRENLLFGLGDGLTAALANVDKQFLAKHGLTDDYHLLTAEQHSELFNDLNSRFKVDCLVGGAVFNTLKLFQWMLKEPKNVCTYFCSVGNDERGEELKEGAKRYNVDGHFHRVEGVPTGTCSVLVTGNDYLFAVYLGAAALHYGKEKHLDLPENWKLVEKAGYYYLGGYSLLVSPDPLLKVGKYASETNRPFTFSLSHGYIVRTYKDSLSDVLKYVDVLFGNDGEALTLAKESGYPSDDVKAVAKWLRELPKENRKRERVVVVTQGRNDTVVATAEGVKLFPVAQKRQDDNVYVSCTGAGDAFVGGFLSQFVQEKPLEDCVRAGHYASSVPVKRFGCDYPELKSTFA